MPIAPEKILSPNYLVDIMFDEELVTTRELMSHVERETITQDEILVLLYKAKFKSVSLIELICKHQDVRDDRIIALMISSLFSEIGTQSSDTYRIHKYIYELLKSPYAGEHTARAFRNIIKKETRRYSSWSRLTVDFFPFLQKNAYIELFNQALKDESLNFSERAYIVLLAIERNKYDIAQEAIDSMLDLIFRGENPHDRTHIAIYSDNSNEWVYHYMYSVFSAGNISEEKAKMLRSLIILVSLDNPRLALHVNGVGIKRMKEIATQLTNSTQKHIKEELMKHEQPTLTKAYLEAITDDYHIDKIVEEYTKRYPDKRGA